MTKRKEQRIKLWFKVTEGCVVPGNPKNKKGLDFKWTNVENGEIIT